LANWPGDAEEEDSGDFLSVTYRPARTPKSVAKYLDMRRHHVIISVTRINGGVRDRIKFPEMLKVSKFREFIGTRIDAGFTEATHSLIFYNKEYKTPFRFACERLGDALRELGGTAQEYSLTVAMFR